jgi:peptidoglycan hydrolase CwlO-like protein
MGRVPIGRVLSFRRSPRASLRATITIAALFVAGSLSLASSPAGASTASQLRDAEAKLSRLIADVGAAAQQRDVLQGQLDVLAGKISDAQGSIEKTQADIVDTQHQIAGLANDIGARQGVLDARAKAAYESGPASSLEFFLGAQSLTDLQDRIEIVNAAAASDRSLIDGMTETKNQLHVKETRLDALKAQFLKKEGQLKAQQRLLDEKFAEQKVLLARLATDEASVQALVGQLKVQRQKEIAQALAEAERRRREQQQHGSNGGGGGNWVPGIIKVCPVRGPHGYSDSFGAPRYGGGYHPHAGNDIMSPLGTPIVAPFDGTAEDGSNGLGGLTVVVTGSDGWVYNAHLSAYAATGHVSAGTVIGYVGNTGDAQGGPMHDHFEWHPNAIPQNPWKSPYGYTVIGTAIDPYPYLNAVC